MGDCLAVGDQCSRGDVVACMLVVVTDFFVTVGFRLTVNLLAVAATASSAQPSAFGQRIHHAFVRAISSE